MTSHDAPRRALSYTRVGGVTHLQPDIHVDGDLTQSAGVARSRWRDLMALFELEVARVDGAA